MVQSQGSHKNLRKLLKKQKENEIHMIFICVSMETFEGKH